MPTERLIYGSSNQTEQQRHTRYHISLLKASLQFLSSSMSGLYLSVFLFALLFADHFLLFTNQTRQHNMSSKCQDYTTDLITCHFNNTSLCKLLIQSNTAPNVNRERKEKKNQSNSSARERWKSWKEKSQIFIEKERLLCYLQLSSKKRQNQTLNYQTTQPQKKCHQLSPTMTLFSVKTKCCTYIQKYKKKKKTPYFGKRMNILQKDSTQFFPLQVFHLVLQSCFYKFIKALFLDTDRLRNSDMRSIHQWTYI